jgi:ABC-type uncharacterized transport system substrate-binding protein
MAVEGLDANKDGIYSRQELAELAQVNMDGLKEFNYFTHPTLAGQVLKLGEPAESWLEHKDGVLALHFIVPLAQPVLADAAGFAFSTYDPSYFIAFDLAKNDPVKLGAGAPKGCKLTVGVPKGEADAAQKLGESFSAQLGGSSLSFGVAPTVSLGCGNS